MFRDIWEVILDDTAELRDMPFLLCLIAQAVSLPFLIFVWTVGAKRCN